jgi:curved DNA-binding protein
LESARGIPAAAWLGAAGDNNPAAGSINREAMAGEFNSSSTEPVLAISSRHLSGRGRSAFGGFGGRQATTERGADVEADIMVTLEEALHGSTRTVSLRRTGSDKVEQYQVKIPRGVHEGQRIRLRGQGEAGVRGGKSGDLFLRVRLARHPDFTVEGSDLIHEVKIQPWQAVLGSELLVPTLEGKVRLKIPAGTQGGQRFRLRERGLPGVSGKRGDLYVVAQINVPKKITEREKEIWRELEKLHGG